jgi:glycosyltransferase involved in cell wall biosynthesis
VKREALSGRRVWVMAKGYLPDEGGMQTYAHGVAEAYAAAGAHVTVFSQTSKGPRRERIGSVTLVDIGAGKSPLVPFRFLSAMRKERAAGEPLFVHGTTWRTSLMPLLLGLPFVTTFHGREFMYGTRLTLGLIRRVAGGARAIVAVSHYSGARLQKRLGPACPRPLIAWNGLSALAAVPAGPSEGAPLLFSLCRLEPRKNIAACVRACAAMRAAGLPFRYVIGGRGPELDRIRELVCELALDDQIEVAGFMAPERASALYGQARIFLHPQIEVDGGRDFEGFGIAIADAMAAETAVIVGSEGGAKELVDEGVTGLIVDGRRDDQLEAALHRLLSDEALRDGMAKAARSHAEANFRWDRHIETIVAHLSG